MLVLYGVALGIALVQHGKPKTGNHSFWVQLIASGIGFTLLWWGGFFNKLF